MKRRILSLIMIVSLALMTVILPGEKAYALSLQTPSITSLTSSNGTVDVRWGDYGYPVGTTMEIYDFTNDKVHRTTANSYRLVLDRDISVGQTLQIQLRAFYVDNNNRSYYSDFSTLKTIKVISGSGSSLKQLGLNQWYSGTSSDEPDTYQFTTTSRSDSKYRFVIRATYAEDIHFSAQIDFGSQGDVLAYDYPDTDDEDYSESRSLSANTTYRIRVYGDHYGFYESGVGFEFIVQEVIAKPAKGKVNSWTAGKRKATVRFAALAKATKYQIAYKIKGGSYRYITTSGTSRTIKSLKSNRYYYVKVRGRRTVDGEYYYGPWSAAKKVKVK